MTTCENKDCGAGCGCCSESPERYLELLHKTPVNTVCPNFYLFDHARGCRFECSYCFLRDEEYDFKQQIVFTDKKKLFEELKGWIKQDNLESYLANSGNMADSLAFEHERPLWGELVEFMREHAEKHGRKHTLLVLTKAGSECCNAFFEREPCNNIIISFSINAPDAARDHEHGAATPAQRLEAARRLIEQGWRVRIRIDPMIKGYDYTWLIEEIRKLKPERVTLGTLRADPTLQPMLRGESIFKDLVPGPEGSIGRYPDDVRRKMYGQAVDRLRDVTSLGLCEETPEMWDSLGLDTVNKTCNCNP